MSTAERRQEEKEQRRSDIIDAAEVVFAQKGVDKATMADVAKVARLSRGLIYFYFKDKDDLYLGIMFRATQALYEVFVRASADLPTGCEKIRAMGEAYAEFYRSQPNYFHAMADFEARQIDASNPMDSEADCLIEGKKVLDLMAAVIEEGVRDGSIRQNIGDPMSTAICLWGFLHGIIQLGAKKEEMFGHLFKLDMKQLVDHAFGMMENSLTG
jgi:AcrR family transcriptional regulator